MMIISLNRAKHSKLTGRTLVRDCLVGIELNKGTKVEIDFGGISLVSQSFLNELFKQLFTLTGGLDVTFKNVEPSVQKVVEKEYERILSKVIPGLSKDNDE